MTTTTKSTVAKKDHQEQSKTGRNILLFVLMVGAFVLILNQTLLNVALPKFMEYFSITASEAQWVTTLFMLVNGIMIPVTAFLIGKFSTRTLFITAMALFSLGTFVAGISQVYWLLLIGRVLQAAGGGIIMPLMQTILFAMFDRNNRGSAMGMFGLIIGFAPAIGPSLSGWIIDNHSWRALFWMMLPFSLFSLIIAVFMLRNVTEQTNPKLDILSVILSTLGFGGLLFGFSFAGSAGWASIQVLAPLAVGTASLVWFVIRQLQLEEPLLELRVLAVPQYTLGTVLGLLSFFAMAGGMIILPVFMQDMVGFSALESGLALLPGAVVMGLMSPVTGKLFDRFGGKWLSVIGFAIMTATTIMLGRLTPDTTFTYIACVNFVRMIGTAMVMMPTTTAALNQLPQRLVPHGTAVNNTLRQVAGSVGTAILVTVMVVASQSSSAPGLEAGIHGANVAFMVSAGFAAVGFILSFYMRHSHGCETVDTHVATRLAPEASA